MKTKMRQKDIHADILSCVIYVVTFWKYIFSLYLQTKNILLVNHIVTMLLVTIECYMWWWNTMKWYVYIKWIALPYTQCSLYVVWEHFNTSYPLLVHSYLFFTYTIFHIFQNWYKMFSDRQPEPSLLYSVHNYPPFTWIRIRSIQFRDAYHCQKENVK